MLRLTRRQFQLAELPVELARMPKHDEKTPTSINNEPKLGEHTEMVIKLELASRKLV